MRLFEEGRWSQLLELSEANDLQVTNRADQLERRPAQARQELGPEEISHTRRAVSFGLDQDFFIIFFPC